MALIKCRECKREVSSKAEKCPNCGVKLGPTNYGCGTIAGLCLVAFVLFVVLSGREKTPTAPTPASPETILAAVDAAVERDDLIQASEQAQELIARYPSHARTPELRASVEKWQQKIDTQLSENSLTALDAAVAREDFVSASIHARGLIEKYPSHPRAPELRASLEGWKPKVEAQQAETKRKAAQRVLSAKWSYSDSADSMTGKRTRTALIRSENSVDFSFPYQGPQRGSLLLRDHPQYGKDVIFSIERGQLICGFSDCSVQIRFGDEKVQTFRASRAADSSTEHLFIRNYDAFVRGLKRSEIVRVQVTAYQQGNPVFEFATGGVDSARIP